MEIIYSSKFAREYKRLPDDIKNKAEEKEIIFRKNPFDDRLKTHKLNEKFTFFHSIGDHRIYR